MRIPRIHITHELRPGREVHLPDQAGEHVARVLRLERGAPLILFSGDGREFDAALASLAKHAVTAEVGDEREANRESTLPLTLAQAIARGERMDWVLQKATELGVARIVPIITERTEVKLDAERAERRMAHWRGVIAGACEQCGRNRLPELEPPQALEQWLATLADTPALRLALLPEGEATLRQLPQMDAGAMLVVGPEGGFSPNDIARLNQARFLGLRLGPRILRTETAGI
ncbi:MAG: 16S rRNA (uracil(1498)-N(3))-methyltransferase, partial [Proteobacteria bacterium]|nr:16S rRNA (uracil(1498)-N(3))-methyltransferase [Pseudomonadota bacterium]